MPKRNKHLASLASARKVRAALASQANTPAAGRASPGTSTSASSSLPVGYKAWKKCSNTTYRIHPVKKFRKALDKKLKGWDGEALFRRTFHYYNGSFRCAKNVRLLQQVYGNSTAVLNTVRMLDLRTRVDEHGQPLASNSPLKAADAVRARSAPDRLTPRSQAKPHRIYMLILCLFFLKKLGGLYCVVLLLTRTPTCVPTIKIARATVFTCPCTSPGVSVIVVLVLSFSCWNGTCYRITCS